MDKCGGNYPCGYIYKPFHQRHILTLKSTNTDFNRFRKHRFVNEKRLKSYPAIKICRLGIDKSVQGKQIGTFLLDFVGTLFMTDNKSGCRFLTVDAYAQAIPFYLKNDFAFLSSDDED